LRETINLRIELAPDIFPALSSGFLAVAIDFQLEFLLP